MSHATDPEDKVAASHSARSATLRWAHPFVSSDTKESESLRSYFAAISSMTCGFSPLSPNHYINDSLYFDMDAADGFPLYDGFRCIADGEVIAYLKKRGGEP